MQFKPLIEYDAFAEFLFDTKAAGAAASNIAERNEAVKGRERELLQLRSALFADKVSIENVKSFLGKAFGLEGDALNKLYTDFLGYFVLPLEQYAPEVIDVLKSAGAQVSDYPETRVGKEARTVEQIVEEVLAERSVELNPDLKKRLVFLSNAYLTGDRDREKTKLLFMRGSNLGGLELSDSAAENFLKELDEELQVSQVVEGAPDNGVIPAKAGIQAEDSSEDESSMDPLVKPEEDVPEVQSSPEPEPVSAEASAKAEEPATHLEQENQGPEASDEVVTLKDSESILSTGKQARNDDNAADEVEASQVPESEGDAFDAVEPVSKEAEEAASGSDNDVIPALNQVQHKLRQGVRAEDSTDDESHQIDEPSIAAKDGNEGEEDSESDAEPGDILAEAGILPDEFEDEPVKESMYERATTANAVDFEEREEDQPSPPKNHTEFNSKSSESEPDVSPAQSEDSDASTESSLPALAVTHALAKEVPVISGSILQDHEEKELVVYTKKAKKASIAGEKTKGGIDGMMPELLASIRKQLTKYEITDSALEGIVSTMLRGIRDAKHVEKLLADRYKVSEKDIQQAIAMLKEAKQHLDLSLRPGLGEPMVDLKATSPKKPKRKVSAPPAQKAPAAGAIDNTSLDGIHYEKRSVGPVDEIRGLTVGSFRRLGLDTEQITNEMKQRFNLIKSENYSNYELAIDAWTDSEVYRVYTEMLLAAIEKGDSVSNIATERRKNSQLSLNAAEIEAITLVNHFLHI
jgi:hypothetical protein